MAAVSLATETWAGLDRVMCDRSASLVQATISLWGGVDARAGAFCHGPGEPCDFLESREVLDGYGARFRVGQGFFEREALVFDGEEAAAPAPALRRDHEGAAPRVLDAEVVLSFRVDAAVANQAMQ